MNGIRELAGACGDGTADLAGAHHPVSPAAGRRADELAGVRRRHRPLGASPRRAMILSGPAATAAEPVGSRPRTRDS